MTTQDDYTPMRLLAYDFAGDNKVLDCKDQFMYGPAFMACPVLEEGKTSRSVYLPTGTTWFDYWTNQTFQGGSTLTAEAPIDKIPLYIKAGSIIPSYNQVMGNEINHEAPIRVDVYAGADGKFVYYEDDGSSIDYQKGAYKEISLAWNNTQQTLSITPAKGNYAIKKKTFEVYLHKDGKVSGKKVVNYKGAAVAAKLK